MPATQFAEEKILNQIFGATGFTAPAPGYFGLLVAPTWLANTVYAVGAYVTGTAFGSTNRHIFKATATSGSGTSGASEPAWNQGAGATTVDNAGANQITWTECTNLFLAGTFTAAEPSGSGYARVSVANNTTNWPASSGGNPASGSNGVAITFPSSTAAWGSVAGFLLSDASSAGNYWAWGYLSSLLVVGSSGITPSFAIGALSVTLT